MEFLKEILGDDLFEKVKSAVSSYNEKADKDKRVSIANVNSEDYVTKATYEQLKNDLNNTKSSLETANNTIKDLKKSNSDNEGLQQKISEYENEKKALETKHKEETQKLVKEMAIKEALYSQKAKHPELLLTKFDLGKILLDEKGEKVVAGIDEQIKDYKETYKDLFEEVDGDNNKGSAYKYKPAGGNNDNNNKGVSDFVGIIKENQSRKL